MMECPRCGTFPGDGPHECENTAPTGPLYFNAEPSDVRVCDLPGGVGMDVGTHVRVRVTLTIDDVAKLVSKMIRAAERSGR